MRGKDAGKRIATTRRKPLKSAVKIVQRDAELAKIVAASDSPTGFARLLYGRKQNRDKSANDRECYQEFDQRKPGPLSRVSTTAAGFGPHGESPNR
jgi:hypothetical protein